MTETMTFLHVGCGKARKDRTTRTFAGPAWRELRFDIDPAVAPDIVGNIVDMAGVADASVDAIFSSHNLEHLYAHEVPLALRQFHRVLRPQGFAVITCPDLQSIAALVAEDKLTETAYLSPAGPIAPIDMIFGYRPSLAAGNLFMAHRCGFTERVLSGTLRECGFGSVATARRLAPHFDLWAIAAKSTMPEDELRGVARDHFPF
jgi:SAM-dependent methyltransferase